MKHIQSLHHTIADSFCPLFLYGLIFLTPIIDFNTTFSLQQKRYTYLLIIDTLHHFRIKCKKELVTTEMITHCFNTLTSSRLMSLQAG